METSIFLAKVIGIFYLVVGLAFITNKKMYKHLVKDLFKHEASLFTIGMFTLIVGLLISVAHPFTEIKWTLLITIIGWLGALKGVAILLFSKEMQSFTKKFDTESWRMLAILVAFGFGLYLSYYGFIA